MHVDLVSTDGTTFQTNLEAGDINILQGTLGISIVDLSRHLPRFRERGVARLGDPGVVEVWEISNPNMFVVLMTAGQHKRTSRFRQLANVMRRRESSKWYLLVKQDWETSEIFIDDDSEFMEFTEEDFLLEEKQFELDDDDDHTEIYLTEEVRE